MADSNGNGSGMPEAPEGASGIPPELVAAIADMAGMLLTFAPHLTEREASEIGAYVISEHVQLAQQLVPDLFNESAEKNPIIGMMFKGPDGGTGQLEALKDVSECETGAEVISYAVMVGFIAAPLMRGILRAHGMDYRFFQKPVKEKQLIVSPY